MSARNGPGDGKGRPRQGALIPSSVQNLDIVNGTPDQRQSHEHTRQVRGCLVVVVEMPGEKYRRRTFLTLKVAERACRRADEAGHPASVIVPRLEPVAVIR